MNASRTNNTFIFQPPIIHSIRLRNFLTPDAWNYGIQAGRREQIEREPSGKLYVVQGSSPAEPGKDLSIGKGKIENFDEQAPEAKPRPRSQADGQRPALVRLNFQVREDHQRDHDIEA